MVQVRELWAFRTSCLGTKRLMVKVLRHFAKCISNRKLFERRAANPAEKTFPAYLPLGF